MNKITVAALAALACGPSLAMAEAPAPAHVYHGRHHYYHHRCRGGNGAVGTIAGGAGGALIGHAVIGGPVGLVAGAVGGGLLGRHLDKVHTRHRRGC